TADHRRRQQRIVAGVALYACLLGALHGMITMAKPDDHTPTRLEAVDPAHAAASVVPVSTVRRDRAVRVLDVVVAFVGLVITLPFWLLIAVLIKLTSRGPVFYTQTRVGLDTRLPTRGREDSRRVHDLGGK